MSVIIKGFDKPKDCLGCPFLSKLTEVYAGDGLYKKVGYCKFASDIMPDLEDPWHDVEWLHTHTEEWCPMTQIKENATPYNPSGDLISREALIREIGRTDEWYKGRSICDILDNAQAVPLPNEQIAWEQGYEAGLAQGKQDRPQGEWIITEELKGACNIVYKTRKCNKCGWEFSLVIPRNFCPNCGADMREAVRNEETIHN